MNSQSQMHNLVSKPFELSDFSFDMNGNTYAQRIIDELNSLRNDYLIAKEKRGLGSEIIWQQILELIPQSYNYTRTVSLNYEVAMQIIEQRNNHKLVEWHQLIDRLLELPYMREFAESAGLIE